MTEPEIHQRGLCLLKERSTLQRILRECATRIEQIEAEIVTLDGLRKTAAAPVVQEAPHGNN